MADRALSLSEYETLRRLQGSDLEIYLGADRARTHEFALVVAPATMTTEELDRAVARCKNLRHRAIAPVARTFDHDGGTVVVCEGAGAASLLDLEQRGPLPLPAVWHIGAEIAAALEAMTDGRNLAHDRLLPAHVLVSYDGGVRLFALPLWTRRRRGADALDAEWSGFVAPEVRRGIVITPRANVYALAAIVWWLLTREPPAAEPGELPPAVPDEIARALRAALTPEPRARTMRASELRAIFAAASAGGRQALEQAVRALRAAAVLPSSGIVRVALGPENDEDEEDEGPTQIRSLSEIRATVGAAQLDADGSSLEAIAIELPLSAPSETPDEGEALPVETALHPLDATIRRLALRAIAALSLFSLGILVGTSLEDGSPPPRPRASARLHDAVDLRVATAPVKAAPPASLADLPPGHGYLEVRSAIEDARVYVFGRDVGSVNEPLALPCSTYFVRIGIGSKEPHWYAPGRSVHVPCGKVTSMLMGPSGAGVGAVSQRSPQWLPDAP